MRIRNNYFVYQFIILLTVFLLFIPFSQSLAGSDHDTEQLLTIDPDKQFEFAEYYFLNKEYSMAVSEYKRFIYFFPEDEKVEPAMHRIGMSYYYGKRFTKAIDSFKALIDRYGETDLSVKSYLMISESYMKLNSFGPAIINLQNLITITDDENVRDEAYYRLGWIYLETASWDKAGLYFSKISNQNKDKYRLERLTAELDKIKLIPKKDPGLAGFLSIIPGAGFLYCERYQDALIAFLLNGGLMYAAYESFDNGHDALGGVIAFVEFGFYAGNIYGSIAGAHKYNHNKTGQFLEKLKNNTKVNLSADFNNKGVCFALQFVF
ncbi:MAG: hypothetical protein BBJ57_03450 [Desulfobacterales bacterium PC51MH44]|nr:MAG: hypothetical protein BBJ57_03450 [Desulfobacterales bacterium PC51MH44]